jgi:hypothetical protein
LNKPLPVAPSWSCFDSDTPFFAAGSMQSCSDVFNRDVAHHQYDSSRQTGRWKIHHENAPAHLAILIRTSILEESLNSHQIWYLLTSVFPTLSGTASDGVETRKPNAT